MLNLSDKDFNFYFSEIKKRYKENKNSCYEKSFIDHLKNLANWNKEKTKDSPVNLKEDFPEEIFIAFAVCCKDCGVKEFIVEGSTQECQSCGKLMFRNKTKKYKLLK